MARRGQEAHRRPRPTQRAARYRSGYHQAPRQRCARTGPRHIGRCSIQSESDHAEIYVDSIWPSEEPPSLSLGAIQLLCQERVRGASVPGDTGVRASVLVRRRQAAVETVAAASSPGLVSHQPVAYSVIDIARDPARPLSRVQRAGWLRPGDGREQTPFDALSLWSGPQRLQQPRSNSTRRGTRRKVNTYRGHEGPVDVLAEIEGLVEGVFGLDHPPEATPHFGRCPRSLWARRRSSSQPQVLTRGRRGASGTRFRPSTHSGETIGTTLAWRRTPRPATTAPTPPH